MSENFKTYLAITAAVLFWGLSFIGTKIALQSFTVYSLIFLRFCIASIIFLLLFILQGFPQISAKENLMLLSLAIIQPVLYFIFETMGLYYTNASTTSLIIATIPIAVMLLAYFILGESISLNKFLGIILSFLGIAILVWGSPQFSLTLNSLKGVVMLMGAVLCGAIYSILIRSFSSTMSVLTITGFQMFYGMLFLTPMFIHDYRYYGFKMLSIAPIVCLFFLALFSTVTAFLSYNYALTKIPASQATVFLNAVPAVTVLGAWFVLHEKLTALQILGATIIIASLYLANKDKSLPKTATDNNVNKAVS